MKNEKFKNTNQNSKIFNFNFSILNSRREGITLIELVIGMVLIGIVALVVANALSTGITGFFVVDNRKEALDQARIAMDRMAKEMRNVRSSSISAADSTQFCFTDINGTLLKFSLQGSDIKRKEGGSDCSTGGTEATLATGISNGSLASDIFTYFDTGLDPDDYTQTPTLTSIKRIKIDFKATAGSAGSEESITLQTEVWPRNL